MKISNLSPNFEQKKNGMISQNKPTAFKGSFNVVKEAKSFFELKNGAMHEKLFIANAFVFLLGGRLLKSRDKDEKRETLTRDIPTIVLAVKGTPWLSDIVAKGIQSNSGFAITDRQAQDKLKPIISKSQLNNWYIFDRKLNTNFKGFMQRLDDQGANLKKVFSSIGGDFKDKISSLSSDNKRFMDELLNNKELKSAAEKAFANSENKAAKAAAFKKLIPQISGLVLTIAIIGIAIPKFNIFITEMINKKKATPSEGEKKPEEVKIDEKATPPSSEEPKTPPIEENSSLLAKVK